MTMYTIRNKDTNALVPLDGAKRTLGDKEEAELLIRELSRLFPAIYFELWEVKITQRWEQGQKLTATP